MTPSRAEPENLFGAAAHKPLLCYVTDRKALDGPESLPRVRQTIAAALAAGLDWVQVREKDLPARELLDLVRAALAVSEQSPRRARVIVNDRLDIALATGAAGVHLGGESLPAQNVVRWCRNGKAPRDFLIGVSCHSLEKAREAEEAGASYIFFGPIFETPSKAGFGPPQGLAKLSEVCRSVRIPVIAIGGVNEANGADCIRAGAAGIAAIRLFQQHDAEALRKAVERLHGGT